MCSKHSKNQIRHGHPEQLSVKVHELKPYIAAVQQRMHQNPSSAAWGILREHWAAVVGQAAEAVQAYEAGKVGNRVTRVAAQQLQALALTVPADSVMQTVLALYLMADARPHRFVSDRGFEFQLVRRVRGLTEASAGTYWDAATSKQKRVYRDLPPKVVEVYAHWLKAAFGAAGLQFAGLERNRATATSDKQKRLAEALGELV